MKNLFNNTSLFITTVITVFLLLIISSCISKTVYSKEVAEELNETKFDSKKQAKDAQFLVDAAENSMIEISIGKLAELKGTTSHIKELGKTSQEFHQKLFDELKVLARRKNITIPTTISDKGNEVYSKLNQNSGAEFDETYADLSVERNISVINLFDKASTKSYDSDIKKWATETLPPLKNILNQSKTSQKQCHSL